VKDIGRFWLAAALAPLSVSGLYALKSLYSGSGFESPFIAVIAATAFVSYIGFLVFGLTFVLLLRAKGRLTYGALLLGGFVRDGRNGIWTDSQGKNPLTFRRIWLFRTVR